MNPLPVVTNEQREVTWRAWQEKNHLQEVRGVDLRAKLTKYASIAVLLLTVLCWGYAAEYQLFVRFAVCAGAVRVAFLAAATRNYAWAALFAGMALLYNPVFPLFALSGRMDTFIVIASVAPFAVSLFALKPRLASSVAAY